MDIKRFSCLTRLVRTIAWIWRAAKRFLGPKRTLNRSKWEAVPLTGVISVRERKDVLRDLFLAAQEGANFPSTTTDRLVVYNEQDSGLVVCGGRVQGFKGDSAAIPLLPCDSWVCTLLARESHSEGHDGVAGILLKMRRK